MSCRRDLTRTFQREDAKGAKNAKEKDLLLGVLRVLRVFALKLDRWTPSATPDQAVLASREAFIMVPESDPREAVVLSTPQDDFVDDVPHDYGEE